MAKTTPAEKAESLAKLREILHPGDEVYTILRKVSQSGMSRQISVVIVQDAKIRDITWHVARALDWKLAKSPDFALSVGGAGMDMGFHVVYTLSRALFPEGYDKTGYDGKIVHEDGGYALDQHWL
jgi:hypothetical protein